MTKQSDPLLLADRLASGWPALEDVNAAAVELRRLHAEAEESDALRERLAALLKATAIALRGPEPKLRSWGWADLPERVAALVAENEALLADAQRYRWLRENALVIEFVSAKDKISYTIFSHYKDDPNHVALDSAIDAAKENT